MMEQAVRASRSRARAARAPLVGAALALSLGGCVGFSPDGGMAPAIEAAADRLGKDVAKTRTDADADAARTRAAKLLRSPLTAATAVQVALSRNQGLQASFNDLGVSEAAYVRASLPPEPRFSVNQLAGMGDLEFVSQAAVGLFALATLPEREAIASEAFRAAQWRAAGEVMALATDVSRQYYATLALKEQEGFLGTSVEGARASAELAQQLGAAGNLNKMEQARESSLYVELGAQLADARLQTLAEREKLTRLMGLWGRDIAFKLPNALPPLPKRMTSERDVEAKALAERLDLKAMRHDLDALARQLGLTTATRYVTDVNLAFQNDNEKAGGTGGSKLGSATPGSRLVRNGFALDFSIPLYDFGESKVVGARETYLAAANRLAQRAIEVRSQAREAYTRYRGKYDLARYYESRVVPLQKTIFEQSALQTNGMLSDVSQLILDARVRTTNSIAAITTKRDFFLSAVDLKAALIGNGPNGTAAPPSRPAAGMAQAAN